MVAHFRFEQCFALVVRELREIVFAVSRSDTCKEFIDVFARLSLCGLLRGRAPCYLGRGALDLGALTFAFVCIADPTNQPCKRCNQARVPAQRSR